MAAMATILKIYFALKDWKLDREYQGNLKMKNSWNYSYGKYKLAAILKNYLRFFSLVKRSIDSKLCRKYRGDL